MNATTEQQMNAITKQKLFIKKSIRTVADYPKPGIQFRDITSLLSNPDAYAATIKLLAEKYRDGGITKVVGIEARGFLFGAPLALELKVGFVPVRKKGKLPGETICASYKLEYGTDALEICTDSICAKDKVLVVDDLLATGGTVAAAVELIRHRAGEVKDAAFVIALPELKGEEHLRELGIECYSLVSFDGH